MAAGNKNKQGRPAGKERTEAGKAKPAKQSPAGEWTMYTASFLMAW